ncbi:unnamed protein product [Phytomonas sp. Hart1]|nr:unnamed protein product [Phytomonas sp. Hart1]|eukprot:CCW71065.1 unnamed protein product [Phytomonas sp. isolate Hart1]
MVDDSQETFTLKLYGNSKDSLQKAAEAMLSVVGVKGREERKIRSEYFINELDINTRAVKLLAACNILNEGTPHHLSEKVIRSIVSTVRFVRPQSVRHFFVTSTNGDREKLDVVSKIISQVKGVQAIMFCEQKRVESFATEGGIQRLTKHFNGVHPKFLYRKMSKEERMKNLEEFKHGAENENGVKQRLLVTNEDYAKLARKTIIPFVNLVINLNVPRDEFYVVQSLVAGRQGTVGISFQFVSQMDTGKFADIKDLVNFEEYTNEQEFREAVLKLSYDTRDAPLTSPDAEPQDDWREHLNDPKPKAPQHNRHK